MGTYVLVALSNPAAGTSDEQVSEWYDGTHIPQIRAAIPGVGDVTRYAAADVQPTPDGRAGYRYLTTYTIEADNAGAVVGALGKGVVTGAVEAGTVLDTTAPPIVAVYERL